MTVRHRWTAPDERAARRLTTGSCPAGSAPARSVPVRARVRGPRLISAGSRSVSGRHPAARRRSVAHDRPRRERRQAPPRRRRSPLPRPAGRLRRMPPPGPGRTAHPTDGATPAAAEGRAPTGRQVTRPPPMGCARWSGVGGRPADTGTPPARRNWRSFTLAPRAAAPRAGLRTPASGTPVPAIRSG